MKITKIKMPPVLMAVLAVVLFGAGMPLSKQLLGSIEPVSMASILYFGCGLGVLLCKVPGFFVKNKIRKEAMPSKKDLYWLFPAIAAGGVIAPIVLMFGLQSSPAATASLLMNFETVSTALFAAFLFKESIGRKIWFSILFITAASIILTWSISGSWGFSLGALGVLFASVFWGLDNNLTRNISMKDPMVIAIIKGFASSLVSLVLSIAIKSHFPPLLPFLLALLQGAVCYGLSSVLLLLSMRHLGAARTSAFFGIAPFIGAIISVAVFREVLSTQFFISLPLMTAGAILIISEKHSHMHFHETLEHNHKHRHDDLHHNHLHDDGFSGEHAHIHTHECLEHGHPHTPDIHHRHRHKK